MYMTYNMWNICICNFSFWCNTFLLPWGDVTKVNKSDSCFEFHFQGVILDPLMLFCLTCLSYVLQESVSSMKSEESFEFHIVRDTPSPSPPPPKAPSIPSVEEEPETEEEEAPEDEDVSLLPCLSVCVVFWWRV